MSAGASTGAPRQAVEPAESARRWPRPGDLFRLEVIGPLLLALLFVATFLSFDMTRYLVLVLTLVGLIQVFPLSSKLVDNLILLCFPVIGAISNVHHVCLTYNSIILFMLCRAYAVFGRVRPRDFVVFFLIISSWPFHFEDRNQITYAGAILHGVVSPVSFYLYTRKSLWIRLCVFAVPFAFLLDNLFLYKQWFVAFWDVEILCVYLFWMLGFDKQSVVQKVLLASLPLITFLQRMHWPICPTKGYLVELVFRSVRGVLHGH